MLLRPQIHLIELAKRYPEAWKTVDTLRADRGIDLPDWPEWCFLPLAGTYAIANTKNPGLPQGAIDVAVLAAAAAWRVTQGVYRFDPDVYQAVLDTPLDGHLPAEVFTLLPEWCVYIETPARTAFDLPLHGFFAHLEHDTGSKRMELRLLLDTETQGLLPFALHLKTGTSLKNALEGFFQEAQRQGKQRGIELATSPQAIRELEIEIAPLVSLVLYLCASNAELRPHQGPERSPTRPLPRKTKKGLRYFPAEKPIIWEAGWRIGSILRTAQEARLSSRERKNAPGEPTFGPHVRRMHWHTYWKGPIKQPEKRTFDVRWMMPIPVLVQNIDELPATVHKVK